MTTHSADNTQVPDKADGPSTRRIAEALAMVQDGARIHAERMAEQLRRMEPEGLDGEAANSEWASHQEDVEAVSTALRTLFEIEKSLIETRATVELLLRAAARRNRALIQARLARDLDTPPPGGA